MFTDTDTDHIIQLVWQDKAPFEAIKRAHKRNPGITFYKCSLQKIISMYKIYKR